MKKTVHSILLLLFCFQANAQIQPAFLLDSTYTYFWDTASLDWNTYSKQIPVYDGQGNTTEKVSYNWNFPEAGWNNDVKTSYFTDNAGNITQTTTYHCMTPTGI